MAKRFAPNIAKEQLIDLISGVAPTNVDCVFKNTRIGKALYMGDGNYVEYAKAFDLEQDWSIVIRCFINGYKDNASWDNLITIADSTANYTNGLTICLNRIIYYDSIGFEFVTFSNEVPLYKPTLVTVTYTASTKTIQVYLNNSANGSNTHAGTLKSATHIFLGKQTSRYLKGSIGDPILYDHVLTSTERDDLYAEFLSAKIIQSPVTNSLDQSLEINASEESLGANLVTNGSFDADTDWTKVGNVTISGGKANYTAGIATRITQNMDLVVGQKYLMMFEISNYSAGNVVIGSNGGYLGTQRSANGKYIEEITWSGIAALYIYSVANAFVGSIDNIVVYHKQELVTACQFAGENASLQQLIPGGGTFQILGDIARPTKKGLLFQKAVSTEYLRISAGSTLTVWSISIRVTYLDLITSINKVIGKNLSGANESFYILGATKTLTWRRDGGEILALGILDTLDGELLIDITSDGTDFNAYVNGSFLGTVTPASTSFSPIYFTDSLYAPNLAILTSYRHYNYCRSLEEIEADWNKYANHVLLRENFEYGADGVVKNIPNTIAGTGDYKINEIALEQGDLFSGWDFTAGWAAISATIVDADTFTTSGIGLIRLNSFLTAGRKYRLRIAGTMTNGVTFYLRSYGLVTYTTWTDASFDKTIEFTSLDAGLTFRMGAVTQVDITLLQIEEIPALPQLISGTPYLECHSANTIAIPKSWGGNTLYWTASPVTGTNTVLMLLVSELSTFSVCTGYTLQFQNDTHVYLVKRGGGNVVIIDSGANAWLPSTFYTLKLEHNDSTGLFTLYILGGEYNTWTLLGSGINTTYSEGKLIGLDHAVGAITESIELTQGVEV